jgi:hypothetical protein
MSMDPLVTELVRAGAEVKGRAVKCPWHDDRHASGSIYQDDAGVWRFKCMVCEEGGDVYDLRAKIDGKPLADILREAHREILPNTTTPRGNAKRRAATVYRTVDEAQAGAMAQVQAEARRDGLDPAGVKFSERWQYTAGFLVARFDLPETDPDTGKLRKSFRPLSRNGNGWSVADPPGPLPLYGADRLPPSGLVFLVEGERKVDRLREVGLAAVTSAHGAKSPEKSDWRPVGGRDLIGLPDNDESGTAYVDKVGQIVTRLSPPASVRVLVLPALPPKGDMVDFLGPEGPMDGKSEDECRAAILALAEAAPNWTPKADAKVSAASAGASARHAEEKPAQAEAIVRLALERYRLGQTDAGEPFAVDRGGPNLARVFRGGREAFRAALARDYRRAFGRTANASALADALTTLEGEGLDTTPEAVGLRSAEYDGGIVLDLGDPEGRAVLIQARRWEVLPKSPVLFRRTALTGPLPVPQRGSGLDDLRGLLNLSDDTWPLVRGWLVGALLPSIPHPILLLGGEQGTGKSTAARMLVNLIDPSPAPLRSEPRDAEGWALAAAGSWAVAVDNVSRIPGWWSDVLCRAVSGDGWVRRRLYTDADLTVLAFRRVVILTSIDAGAMRGDLGDRLLLADLGRIKEGDRKAEADLDRAYASARPRLLGGLLDTLADVLARLPDIPVRNLPRMADFARVLAAVDEGSGGRALDLYRAQTGRIAGEILESDPVAVAVLGLLDKAGGQWGGTTTELLQAIMPGDKFPRGWPESVQGLAGRLKRLTPALRADGVEVERDRAGHNRARRLTLRRTAESIVRTVRNDAEGENPGLPCGRSADDADGCGRSGPADCPPDAAQSTDVASGADDADGSARASSGKG